MTCLEAQSLITPYINDELDLDTMEAFLAHVNECKECKEELDVYYTLLTSMKLLDEDKELSNNFSQDLENKLKASAEKLRKRRNRRIRKRFYFLTVLLGFIIISSIQVGTVVIAPIVPKKPSFILKNIQVKPDYMDHVTIFVERYDEQATAYVTRRKQQKQLFWESFEKNRVDHWLFELNQKIEQNQELNENQGLKENQELNEIQDNKEPAKGEVKKNE